MDTMTSQERRAASKKQWQENNRDKVLASKKKYRENNKDKIAAHAKQYQNDNKDIINERNNQWRNNNKDKVAGYNKKWYDANQETRRAEMREYAKQRVQCECGKSYGKNKASRHKASQYHQAHLTAE